jgi:hypothetical protein
MRPAFIAPAMLYGYYNHFIIAANAARMLSSRAIPTELNILINLKLEDWLELLFGINFSETFRQFIKTHH